MCKKLMFLISFVLLISWGAVASAANLEISCDATYTVTGTENYDEWDICGTVIVPEGATLTASGESTIDGENATLLVDGGTASISNRINMGKGEGALLIVQNGGSFTQSDDGKICMPDDEGGEIRLRVYDGTVTARSIELIGIGSGEDRGARVEVGYGATIYTCDIHNTRDGEEVRNPVEWLADGDMYGIDGVATPGDITVEVDGDCATVTTPPACDPLKAAKPSPANGEKGVASVVSDVILSWEAACGVGELGRHYVFFSTDKACVEDAPPFTPGWEEPDCYVGYKTALVPTKNMGNQPIWTKFFWRVDQKHETGLMVVGDVWQFTTGCDPVPAGDVNLDCLINLEDWALMLTTWGEEQFFPWD